MDMEVVQEVNIHCINSPTSNIITISTPAPIINSNKVWQLCLHPTQLVVVAVTFWIPTLSNMNFRRKLLGTVSMPQQHRQVQVEEPMVKALDHSLH
jgi:hypothetical protein